MWGDTNDDAEETADDAEDADYDAEKSEEDAGDVDSETTWRTQRRSQEGVQITTKWMWPDFFKNLIHILRNSFPKKRQISEDQIYVNDINGGMLKCYPQYYVLVKYVSVMKVNILLEICIRQPAHVHGTLRQFSDK